MVRQEKKLSLQVQETEAHGAFLKVIELMNSSRTFDHIEAVQLCGQICSRFASPTIVNSAFMRIAEAFKNGSNTLQVEVLKVIQRNAHCLKKIHNYAEFIRPIFTVMYSNDPIARAVTLRLLAAIAVSIPDQLDVHHAIRMALQSDNRSELAAALYASSNLAKISGAFAEAITADVIALLDKPDLSDDERIAILSIVPFVTSSRINSDFVTSVIDSILQRNDCGFQSSTLIETCLKTISDLISRGLGESSIEEHLFRLKKWICDDRPEVGRISAKEMVRFFRLCAIRIPSSFAAKFIEDLMESKNDRLVVHGIKCAAVYLHDPLADYGSFLEDNTFLMFINYGYQLTGVMQAYVFALLCRIVALRTDKFEQRQSVIVHATTGKGTVVSELDQRFLDLFVSVGKSARSNSDLSALKWILFGLHSRNTVLFPELIVEECFKQIPHLLFPDSTSLLPFLRFLQDLSAKKPVLAVDLLNTISHWSAANLDFQLVYELAILSTALQFSASDALNSQLDQHIMAIEVVKRFDLSSWNVFRLARTALADGRHVFALTLFNFLLDEADLSKSSLTYNWIQILRDLAKAEITKTLVFSDKKADVQQADSSFMSIQLKLGDFRKSNRFGLFKKLYLDIRMNLQISLELLLSSVEKVRHRCSEMGGEHSFSTLISSFMSLSLQKFRTTEQDSVRLLSLMFDADGPSLAIVGLNRRICMAFCCAITNLLGKGPGTKVGTAPSLRGTEATFKMLEGMLTNPVLVRSPAEAYNHLQTLYQASMFFLNFPMPVPRYFMQQYQQTSLSVNITPAPTSDKEFSVTLNMETKFTLKIEGMLNVEAPSQSKLMRVPNSVRIVVKTKLVKSLPFTSKALCSFDTSPDIMTHLASVKDLNFFAHTFVMTLGYPGVYKLTIDFEFEDHLAVLWDALQSANLFVKVVENYNQGKR